MTEGEIRAIGFLPERIYGFVTAKIEEIKCSLSEIRLRRSAELSLTADGRNYLCGTTCTGDELDYVVAKLSKNSLYSQAASISEGVITTEFGIRAGVCGTAVVSDGRIACVRDITSVCIRVPHRVDRAAEPLRCAIETGGSILIHSPPGGGKTTVLRELVPMISREMNRRCAVIDTRYELSVLGACGGLCDVFLGYPRYEGIVSAVRTMSPEYVICDEISDERDLKALRYARSSGVAVCASAHASSRKELMSGEIIPKIIAHGVFDYICSITAVGNDRRILVEAIGD